MERDITKRSKQLGTVAGQGTAIEEDSLVSGGESQITGHAGRVGCRMRIESSACVGDDNPRPIDRCATYNAVIGRGETGKEWQNKRRAGEDDSNSRLGRPRHGRDRLHAAASAVAALRHRGRRAGTTAEVIARTSPTKRRRYCRAQAAVC